MAVFVQTAVGILVDEFQVAGFADKVEVSAEADAVPFTNFASGGWKIVKPGLSSYSVAVDGFQDFGTTGVDALIPITDLGATHTITVTPTGGATVADPAFITTGVLGSDTPLTGNVGDPARFALSWMGGAKLVRGQVLHPSAARTATGSGTACTFTTPTAAQTLYANFHVTSVSGSGTITFTIQTDDNSGFTSASTRITSSAMAAVGGETGSLAGALASETHIRVGYTISGFTSVTFTVAAGVL